MISVIIPYVKDRYLGDAMMSVRMQTYEDWEIIPVCGDRTQGENINRGLRNAEGEYIKILHDDDTLPRTSLQDLYDGIQGYDWVCGDHETFGDDVFCPNPGIYKGRLPVLEEMLKGNYIGGGTTLYRKDILLEVGGYDVTLFTGEEYDLHLKLLYNGYKCNYIPKVVHNYRLHGYNKSYSAGPDERKWRQEYIREIAKKYDRGNNI